MTERNSLRANRDAQLVLGIALVVSVSVVCFIFRSQGLVANRPDPYEFAEFGRRIAHGEGFRGEIIGRRAPLYPIFIGCLYWLFGEHALIVQLAQCALFAGTAALAWDMGRTIYNRRTGLFAGLLCALHPSLLRYVPDFHLECLLAFLFTLFVWTSVRLYRRPTLANAAYFGIVAGLTSLTKAVALLYPPLFLALLWFTRRREARASGTSGARLSLPTAAAVIACMALTISPWTIRNYRVSGQFVPVSTGLSDAFLRGYVFSKTEFITLRQPPYTDAENQVNAEFRQLCAAEGAVWEADPIQTDKILARAAKVRLREDFLGFVRKSIVGIFTFWYEMTSLTTSLVAGLLALFGWVFTFVGVRRAAREGHAQWLLLAPMLYLNAFLALLLSLGRYSVPVLPCLMVTAAFGLDTLASRLGVRLWDSSAPTRS